MKDKIKCLTFIPLNYFLLSSQWFRKTQTSQRLYSLYLESSSQDDSPIFNILIWFFVISVLSWHSPLQKSPFQHKFSCFCSSQRKYCQQGKSYSCPENSLVKLFSFKTLKHWQWFYWGSRMRTWHSRLDSGLSRKSSETSLRDSRMRSGSGRRWWWRRCKPAWGRWWGPSGCRTGTSPRAGQWEQKIHIELNCDLTRAFNLPE